MLDITQLDIRPGTPCEFAELICADPAWLDAEFDAIMTANFGALPPPPVSTRSWAVHPVTSVPAVGPWTRSG